MKPSPRYRLGDVSDIITTQAREIKRLKEEIKALQGVVDRMTRHAEGIQAARRDLIWLLGGVKKTGKLVSPNP